MNNLKLILSSFLLTSTLFATEIKFEAIEYFVPNSRVVISADIEDEVGISEARVYFKSLDSKIYPFVKMSCKASKCSAMLPMVDNDTKIFNYIILFQNNRGEVFKTKIFEVSKRDMIELPNWQTFDKSPLEVKSELLLTPKEILGFRDDFSITPVKDREKYGVVAKIVNMQNAGIKKLNEIPNTTYGGEISESGIDRGIEESIFTTKNMLIGGGVLAGVMVLSSSSKKSSPPTSNLTPTGTNTNSYELSANLEAPLIPPTVNESSAIPTSTPSQNEIPTIPSGNLVPSENDYELGANVDIPIVEPTNSLITTTTSKGIDTSELLTSYPNATLPTQIQKSTTPPAPTLTTEEIILPPSPTLTPEVIATPTPTPTIDTTLTSSDTTASDVSILTTSDGTNALTITTTVTTTITMNPISEITSTIIDTSSTAIDNLRNCNENITSSKSYNESFKIDLKTNSGSTKLTYNMFNSRDRILIYYENSLIYESGCVNFDGSELNDNNKRSPKNLSFNGQDNYITVEVSGDCERSGQIDWSFALSCP